MKGIANIVLIIIVVNFVDEEHVIFHCEAYGKCRLRHQPLFYGTGHNLKTFLSNDNQTDIAWLLWDIRKIRMNLDMEC